MTTAKWLRTVISPLPSTPSAELQRFLAYDKYVTNDVRRQADIILEATFPSSSVGEWSGTGSLQSANLMDSVWAEERRILEALKLYYRVLETMCTAESQIFHACNLTCLLTNERFHRCMLACSAELVLATHKIVTMLFPAVLERTGIAAFDLSKVIDSFIGHEESLPRELRWHEPMLSLDAIAMFNNIFFGGLPPLPFLQRLKLRQLFSVQNGDIRFPKRVCGEYRIVLVEHKSFTSPMKECLMAFSSLKSKLPPPLQSAFASPTRPTLGGGETFAETGINVFLARSFSAVFYGVVKISQLNLAIKEII
ncbi:hypothetical protein NE237_005820 [Protea cynaroides]|uniref:Retinoblastoma-associated protein A-box domain-containing protein n=1 Tax=Protea cynaroides TaxID=273540 RepID=A0A9Q0KLY3_9MAGN|nr:hypothetical protein NE237_005820 [Protea cynaroides]